MEEIRAYIRRHEVTLVVETLRAAGAPGVSIIEIHPLGYGYEASGIVPHKASVVDRYRHLAIVKLEIVCTDTQLERLIHVIEDQCCTRRGRRRDDLHVRGGGSRQDPRSRSRRASLAGGASARADGSRREDVATR